MDDVANYRWPPPEWDVLAAPTALQRRGIIRQNEDIGARQIAPFLRSPAVAARGRVDSGQRGGRGGGFPRGGIREHPNDAVHNAEVDALIAAAPPLRVAAHVAGAGAAAVLVDAGAGGHGEVAAGAADS